MESGPHRGLPSSYLSRHGETEEGESKPDEEEAESDDEDTSWRLPELVYAHLPPNQHDRDYATRRGKAPPKMYATRNFYQIKRIDEIRYRTPLFPSDLWDIDHPERFLLCEDGWGM
jgi:hypothetical protein